jgi:hypothetical protein
MKAPKINDNYNSKCKRPREYVTSLDIGKTFFQAHMIFNTKVHTNLP